jgi:hypothetical protein
MELTRNVLGHANEDVQVVAHHVLPLAEIHRPIPG